MTLSFCPDAIYFARFLMIAQAASDTPAGLLAEIVRVLGLLIFGAALGVPGFGIMPSADRAWFNRLCRKFLTLPLPMRFARDILLVIFSP